MHARIYMMQSHINLTREDSINSSQEVDQPEQESADVATGRSYECVFCKRGFTTAQALGGHMNIHRKDRAKNRSNLNNTNKYDHVETGGSRVSYQPIPSYQESRVNYRTYFPASSGKGDFDHNTVFDKRFGLFGEDLRMGLSSKFIDDNNNMEKKRRSLSEDDGLDLELRLGHDP